MPKIVHNKKMTLVDKVIYRVARFKDLGDSASILMDRRDRAALYYRISVMNQEGTDYYYLFRSDRGMVTVTLVYTHSKGWLNGHVVRISGGQRT